MYKDKAGCKRVEKQEGKPVKPVILVKRWRKTTRKVPGGLETAEN